MQEPPSLPFVGGISEALLGSLSLSVCPSFRLTNGGLFRKLMGVPFSGGVWSELRWAVEDRFPVVSPPFVGSRELGMLSVDLSQPVLPLYWSETGLWETNMVCSGLRALLPTCTPSCSLAKLLEDFTPGYRESVATLYIYGPTW